jgi:hypothetical protein
MKSVGGEITFPCSFDIAENPYSFCDQLEATKAALDAGFEREIVDEIARLRRIHFSPQIGASLETGQVLDFLHEKLYQHFPKKYDRQLTSFTIGGRNSGVFPAQSRHRSWWWLWMLVIFAMFGVVVAGTVANLSH